MITISKKGVMEGDMEGDMKGVMEGDMNDFSDTPSPVGPVLYSGLSIPQVFLSVHKQIKLLGFHYFLDMR